MKKISVIMPIYNASKYLAESIESVLKSTYPNLELVLVNDGSTDASEEICKHYSENHRVVYVYQDNAGSQIARTTGIARATGEYIAFCDSDDRVMPNMYASLAEAIEQYNLDFAACGFRREQFDEVTGIEQYKVVDGSENVIKSIYSGCGGYLWNKLYKKECLPLVSFDPAINLGEDGLYNLRLASKLTRVAYTTTPMYYYRQNETSVTNSHVRPYVKWEKEILAYDKLFTSKDEPFLHTYVSKMLANCIVKGAEACVKTRLKKEYNEVCKLAKTRKIQIFSSKNTKIQYFLISKLPLVYKVLRTLL